MKNKCIIILTLLLCGALLLGISGCGADENITTGSTLSGRKICI